MKMLLKVDVYFSVDGLTSRSEASLVKKLLEVKVFEYLKEPRSPLQEFDFDQKLNLPSGLSRVRASVLTEEAAINSLK